MNIRDFLPNQDPDESIFIFVRPYFLAFLPWLGLGLALVIIGLAMLIVTMLNFPDLAAPGIGHEVLVVIASTYFLTLIPFFTVAFLDYYFDIQIVSDHRLVDINQSGLFRRSVNELDLEEIEDVSSSTKGILSSIFDFGTVEVETAGPIEKFIFPNVKHPGEIAEIILDLSKQAKDMRGQTHKELTPHTPVKGVIDNTLYTNVQDLAKVGVMAPDRVAEGNLIAESPGDNDGETTDKPVPASDLDITIDEPSK